MKILSTILLLISFLVMSGCATTEERARGFIEQGIFSIGSTIVRIPEPSGFKEIDITLPTYKEYMKLTTMPGFIDLSMYVADDYIIRRGFMRVTTPKSLINSYISEKYFQLAAYKLKKTRVDAKFINSKPKPILGFSSKVKKMELLGVYADKKDVIGLLYKYKIGISPALLAYNVLRVKGKLITATVYGNYKSKSDINWIISTSKKWTNAIIRSNNSTMNVINKKKVSSDDNYKKYNNDTKIKRLKKQLKILKIRRALAEKKLEKLKIRRALAEKKLAN